MKKTFELINTYIYESHWWRYLLKCRECGQLYFFEFSEEIDWEKGEDPQYSAYIPVETRQEIEVLRENGRTLESVRPQLSIDYPKGAKTPTIKRLLD